MDQSTDWIKDLLDAWQREYPAVETTALPPLVRLARLAVLIESFQAEVLEPFELTASDYSVLAALRRSGPPYALNPSQLYSHLERSSGGMTKILKRLEQNGLVKRSRDPLDGRSNRVSLTPDGLQAQDRIFHAFLEQTDQLLAGLSASRKKETDRMLIELLDVFEGHFAKGHFAKGHFAKGHFTKGHFTKGHLAR